MHSFKERKELFEIFLILMIATSCLSGRFGKQSTIQQNIYSNSENEGKRTCENDEDCPTGKHCCASICLECCRDSDCIGKTSCGDPVCDEGECLTDKPFRYPISGGIIEPPGQSEFFEIDGTILITASKHTIFLFDISNDSPLLIGGLSFDGVIKEIISQNRILYVLTSGGLKEKDSVHIVDITNPERPLKLVAFSSSSIESFAANEPLLWIFSEGKLYPVNASSPVEPDIIFSTSLPCIPKSHGTVSDLLLVTCGKEGIFSISTSSPLPKWEKVNIENLEDAQKIACGCEKCAIMGKYLAGENQNPINKILVFKFDSEGKISVENIYDSYDVLNFQFDGENLLLEKKDATLLISNIPQAQKNFLPFNGYKYKLSGDAVIAKDPDGNLNIKKMAGNTPVTIKNSACKNFVDADFSDKGAIIGCMEGGALILDTSLISYPAPKGYMEFEGGLKKVVALSRNFVVINDKMELTLVKNESGKEFLKVYNLNYAKEFSAKILSVEGEGKILAVGDDSSMLRIFFISPDGEKIIPVSELKLDGIPYHVALDVKNERIFVRIDGKVNIVDISDIYNPRLLNTLQASGSEKIASANENLFVQDRNSIKHFTETSNSSWNEFEYFYEKDITSITASENNLLIAFNNGILVQTKISDAKEFKFAGDIPFKNKGDKEKIEIIKWEEGQAGILMENLFSIYRLPVNEGSLSFHEINLSLLQEKPKFSNVTFLGEKEGKEFYAASAGNKIFVIHKEGNKFKKIQEFNLLESIKSLTTTSPFNVAGVAKNGILLLDISNPYKPPEIKNIQTKLSVSDVAGDDETFCVLLDNGNIGVFSKSSTQYKEITLNDINIDKDKGIQAGKSRCWGIDRSGGIWVLNAISPASPFLENYIPAEFSGEAKRLFIYQNNLIVAGKKRFSIFDISEPDCPLLSGSVKISLSSPLKILSYSSYLMVLEEEEEVTRINFINIFDLQKPEPAGEIATSVSIKDGAVSVSGNLIAPANFPPPNLIELNFSCHPTNQ